MEDALRAPLVVAALASACALPPPWIELGGAPGCRHAVARDPEKLAPALRWEAGCPGDPIAGCERLVAPAGAGQLVALSAATGPLMRLDIDAGEVRAEAYYGEDGRAVMMVRTTDRTRICLGEVAFAEGRAGLRSLGEPDLPQVLFSAPFPGGAGWRGASVLSLAPGGADVFAPLSGDRVALVGGDAPQVVVVGEGRRDEILAADLDLVDAAIVGAHAALLSRDGELRVVPLAGGPHATYSAEGRQIGALIADRERLYWLELPAAVEGRSSTVTVELRAAVVGASGRLEPQVLARFPHLQRPRFFSDLGSFGRHGHDPELPDLGLGPGGVYVHVGRDSEDLLILARPADGRAWAWTVGERRATPGLGPADPEDRSLERSFRASQVRELHRVLFLSERRLALRYSEGVGDVRRYPLAAFQTQEAALAP